MSSKTAKDRHARLLSHGFFAPELPPCFSSHQLGSNGAAILKDIKSLPLDKGRPSYQRLVSENTTFYFPRFNNADRLHSVINPISYVMISDLISRNYSKLRKLERRSKFSLSHSVFDWLGSRALRRPIFEWRDEFTSQLSTRFEYTATTDIRSFYHSIYTHSIPWAIHGKTFAKVNRSASFFGNEIDLLVRNSQAGQTVGLPGGPDTSRILAEVIASSIDVEINRHTRVRSGDASRFVDDFTFGCNTISEGQRIIAETRRAVTSFELDIGKEKTLIEPTNHLTYVGWKEFLKSHEPADYSKASFERFFYAVHDMAKRHIDLNVEKFAMQICRKSFLRSGEWKFIQEHVVSSYRKNSTLVDSLVECFIMRQNARGDLDLVALTEFVSSRLPVLSAQQRSGEVIWLLFLCCRLGIVLKATAVEILLRDPNPLVAVLVVHAEAAGLISGRIDRSYWDGFATADGLRSGMWLYAYEASVKGWIKKPSTFCDDDPYYGLLFKRNLSLFDIQRGAKTLGEVLRERQRENRLLKFQMSKGEDFDFDSDDDIGDFELEDIDLDISHISDSY